MNVQNGHKVCKIPICGQINFKICFLQDNLFFTIELYTSINILTSCTVTCTNIYSQFFFLFIDTSNHAIFVFESKERILSQKNEKSYQVFTGNRLNKLVTLARGMGSTLKSKD